jgi:hypothetical protein
MFILNAQINYISEFSIVIHSIQSFYQFFLILMEVNKEEFTYNIYKLQHLTTI